MEPGMLVIIAVVILFYVRFFIMRGRRHRREQQEIVESMKKGRKGAKIPTNDPLKPHLKIYSWWLVGAGMLLMVFGLGLYTQAYLLEFKEYWWIPTAIGGIIFTFSYEN